MGRRVGGRGSVISTSSCAVTVCSMSVISEGRWEVVVCPS